MSTSRDITIWCDHPDCYVWDTYGAGHDTIRRTRQTAKEVGWTYRRGKDYCPRHETEKSP